MRRVVGYTLSYRKKNEEIVRKLQPLQITEFIEKYGGNSVAQCND
jgi:hypothetical protein